jgi:predicted exporter
VLGLVTEDVAELALREIALAIVIAFTATLGTIGVVVWALLRAGRLPSPMSLVVALSLLSVIALIGFIFTSNESLLTIAATGVGALAGAVSTEFRHHDKDT